MEHSRMLAVRETETNYLPCFEVTYAASFDEAKKMIIEAEANHAPFDQLDLPVYDSDEFWEFIEWMESTERYYPFSIYGTNNPFVFTKIRNEARRRGFSFLD